MTIELDHDSTTQTFFYECDTSKGHTVLTVTQTVQPDGVLQMNCTAQLARASQEKFVHKDNIAVIEDIAAAEATQRKAPVRIFTCDNDFADFASLTAAGFTIVIDKFNNIEKKTQFSKLVRPKSDTSIS